MSSPAASASPSSNSDIYPAILTPSRRVKALLAQFDDSSSDNEPLHPKNNPVTELDAQAQPVSLGRSSRPAQSKKSDGSEDDDEAILPSAPRGRLAARLQVRNHEDDSSGSEASGGGDAYGRSKSQKPEREAMPVGSITAAEGIHQSSDEDEFAGTTTRRRWLKRKSSPAVEYTSHVALSRSQSPLFFPSPSAAKSLRKSTQSDKSSDADDMATNPVTSRNSKFLELVEKHRRQRLAHEAAEIVKRAARTEKLQSLSTSSSRQRGSSPGDGSEEDSDLSNHGMGHKLSKASQPTRKASKKALEEMKRETQRMTRNMQLAHQAKTKKKVTKESLLARFNFPLPHASKSGTEEDHNKSAAASSTPTSDAEGARRHDTPPTSPLLPGPADKLSPMDLQPAKIFDPTKSLYEDQQELRTMRDILTEPAYSEDKGKGRAVDRKSEEGIGSTSILKDQKASRPIRVKWSKEDAIIARAADSDSDLEIVTSEAKSRKFAVFETLPSRKARQNPSHIALRSLAHITDTLGQKRSSITTAQMEAELRKAARLQAGKERQEKIDELKAKGVVIQSAEEREKNQQELEDLVERARQEAAKIQKREKASAKKDGTFTRESLDDDDDSDDEEDDDFKDDALMENADEEEEAEDDEDGEGEEGEEAEDDEGRIALDGPNGELIDHEAEEGSDEESEEDTDVSQVDSPGIDAEEVVRLSSVQRRPRQARILSDDEDEDSSSGGNVNSSSEALTKTTQEASEYLLPAPAKTPQPVPRSGRKIIPGLQMSDDLPMGLTQAFAATMADSQSQDATSQTQAHDSFVGTRELPSPGFPIVPNLRRLESLDMVTDSQPASQTQPLNLELSFSQSQRAPQSPAQVASTQLSQMVFEPTQDVGFVLSPFPESRFDTPLRSGAPQSTIETVILPGDDEQSPIMLRKGRLRRGRAASFSDDEVGNPGKDKTAFDIMRHAAARTETAPVFDKSKSHAKDIVDEAAEESEDEYAGLGGASDDEVGEENEDDRKMIDQDEGVGQGDEAKLAGLFADKERQQDEAAVSKLLKDITTGALRRKRGVGDGLDLSDEEDDAARRRDAKRREFARMRRELLKDEAVGKIAEDKRKEAFLKSIEDREAVDDDDLLDFDTLETAEEDSQPQHAASNQPAGAIEGEPPTSAPNNAKRKRPLEPAAADIVNRLPPALRRTNVQASAGYRKPSTIAEIRESVSFLIEEPASQSVTPQYGSSDDEDADPEAYVDLNRHLHAEDENEDDGGDLSDFVVDDSQDSDVFKKPQLPSSRAPFTERRTKANVINRRSLLRQASSSSSSSAASTTTKMAFFTSNSGSADSSAFKAPSLLRRATTNSSFGSASNANVSATGVSVATERGAPEREKEVVRKGAGGRRNAVNFRMKPKEEQMKSRVMAKKGKTARSGGRGFLRGLFSGNSWD